MNQISDIPTQEKLIEEVCLKKSRIEISTPEGKFISKLEGTFWRQDQEIYMELNPENSCTLQPGVKYKATVLGNNLILGLIVSIKELGEKVIKLNFPEKVFKINRREAFRFAIPTAYQIPVELNIQGKKHSAILYDVSVEGIAIWVPQDLWPVGTKIDQLYFKLESKEIWSQGEIKVFVPLELHKKKGFKVGIKLIKCTPGCQTHIVSYMNRYLSQYAKKIA